MVEVTIKLESLSRPELYKLLQEAIKALEQQETSQAVLKADEPHKPDKRLATLVIDPKPERTRLTKEETARIEALIREYWPSQTAIQIARLARKQGIMVRSKSVNNHCRKLGLYKGYKANPLAQNKRYGGIENGP